MVNNLWEKSLNSSTRSVYLAGYKCIRSFLRLHPKELNSEFQCAYVFSKISEDVLIYFVSHCQSVLNLKYSTIKLYLAGIRHFGITYVKRNPLIDQFGKPLARLHNIMMSIKKIDTKPLRKKLPITFDILVKLYRHMKVKHSLQTDLNFIMRTACVVAFYGFMRCGEFTCKQTFDPVVNLCISDITFESEHQVNIVLKASKTDIFRQTVTIKLFKQFGEICPYKLLTDLLITRTAQNANGPDPLFIQDTKGTPMTRNFFNSQLKKFLTELGYDGSKFSGHSFRIGAATSCSKNSVQDSMIQTLGRWKSDCYTRYIHISNDDLRAAQFKMCR